MEQEDKRLPIRVEQIRERPDRVPPIVAYFSTKYDPLEVDEDTGEKVYETPKIMIYNHKDDREKMIAVVSPPDANVELVGSSFTGAAAVPQTTSYALGILNRENQTMRILPIACNKIIRLEPRVLSQETLDEEAALRLDQDKKKKRALNVRDNPHTHKFLKVEPSKPDTNAGALTLNIPPYDASATTPREAYPLDKIIQEEEREFLQDIYRLLQQESVADDTYPVFVRNRLHKLRDIEVDSEKQMLSAALSLLTHLVKFKDLFSKEGRDSSDKLCSCARSSCG